MSETAPRPFGEGAFGTGPFAVYGVQLAAAEASSTSDLEAILGTLLQGVPNLTATGESGLHASVSVIREPLLLAMSESGLTATFGRLWECETPGSGSWDCETPPEGNWGPAYELRPRPFGVGPFGTDAFGFYGGRYQPPDSEWECD